jgi:LysM repeat protein
MKKHRLFLTILFALTGKLLFAQSSETIRKYIDTYRDIAIAEEIRTGVPAAITLAQGIHETSAGTSDLVLSSNNHFGIKCKTGWTGATVYHDDDERGECFRKYNDPLESYKDHSDFLKGRPNYASLFNLDPVDYKGWAYGLKKAGYATNPKYPQILIKLIEDYDLQQYTLIALSGKAPSTDAIYASNTEKPASPDEKPLTEPQKAVVKKISYPSGVFKINETKVIFVTKGTAFLKVADENDLSLPRLFEFNDMKATDIAANDQLIYLQRKRKTGAADIHVTEEGESLYDIAQAEGIRIESLMEYNFLKAGMKPAAGEKLYLKEKAPAPPRLDVASAR